jgi:deoxyuridine 5'-triphosphate nucleotidohydrolase
MAESLLDPDLPSNISLMSVPESSIEAFLNNHMITLLDYRGPLGVVLFNFSDVDFTVKAGDRIAQLIVERYANVGIEEVDDLDATARGNGGFGSTGERGPE